MLLFISNSDVSPAPFLHFKSGQVGETAGAGSLLFKPPAWEYFLE
jgi:hypothetical protein